MMDDENGVVCAKEIGDGDIVNYLGEDDDALKILAPARPAYTPFKCGGCNETVTSWCPGDHGGCPNDFRAIRAAVFGSDAGV